MANGKLVSYGSVVWIEAERDGLTTRTEPGWCGPLRFWKAKRYAKKHDILLHPEPQSLKLIRA